MKRNGKGLLALLGVGAGVFAWWKYKNMTPAEKAKIKSQIENTGQKIKSTAQNVEETISEKYDRIKDTVGKKTTEMQS
ncbi:MAG: YtxH domain-containing protein [Flavobacteriaceae bacterium]|nr:YtxH domain-containing protein [Flavobacteriaceae bacterium]